MLLSSSVGRFTYSCTCVPRIPSFSFYKHLLPTGSCTNVSLKAFHLSIIFRRSTQSQIWDSLLKWEKNLDRPGGSEKLSWSLQNQGEGKCVYPWTLINVCGWWTMLGQLLRVVTSRIHCLFFWMKRGNTNRVFPEYIFNPSVFVVLWKSEPV